MSNNTNDFSIKTTSSLLCFFMKVTWQELLCLNKKEQKLLRKMTFTQFRSSFTLQSQRTQVSVKHLQMQNNICEAPTNAK